MFSNNNLWREIKLAKFNLLDKLQNPSGRLDKVTKNSNIFVDYAHTPDALKNVLCDLQKIARVNFLQL